MLFCLPRHIFCIFSILSWSYRDKFTLFCLFLSNFTLLLLLCLSTVHLSLSGAGTASMGLDYVSDLDGVTIVEYQDSAATAAPLTATAQSIYMSTIGYMNNVELSSLEAGTSYKYRIGDGSDDKWSVWYEFTNGPYSRSDFVRKGDSNPASADGVAAVYADLGVFNGLSMDRLKKEATEGVYDYSVHIGDIAYDLYAEGSAVGNEFMELMASVTQRYPLMIGEGNHEREDNFTEYNRRFKGIESLAGKNSKSNSNHYYSFNVGLIHYVMVSTEVYSYPVQAGAGPAPFSAQEQLDWLEADLLAANEADARAAAPWIVLMAHRPWYTVEAGAFGNLDDLACRYGVDLYFTGHVHNYQRWLPMRLSAPVVPGDVDHDCVSEDGHTYTNPKYMPTIVAGSTGCHSPMPRVACPVMKAASEILLGGSLADCSAAYGFGHLQVCFPIYIYI
jgi:hypothetical protein